MTPEVWYSVHHSQFLFCLRFFDITLMSFFRVFVSFLGVPLGIFRAFKGDYHFSHFLSRGRYVWYHLKEVMTPEVWYQTDRSHFVLSRFRSGTTLMNLF